MSEIHGPVRVDGSDDKFYESSNLSQFAWTEDPQGSAGLLFVEFTDGAAYVYTDVPYESFEKMRMQAVPESQPPTTGEYFHNTVRNEFETRGEDYSRFEDVL